MNPPPGNQHGRRALGMSNKITSGAMKFVISSCSMLIQTRREAPTGEMPLMLQYAVSESAIPMPRQRWPDPQWRPSSLKSCSRPSHLIELRCTGM